MVFVYSVTSQADPYCVAIRGNGELMPAHWGAMAKVVEYNGLPISQAGGSSASVTLFLLESIAMNPQLNTIAKQSLAIKSFQGYLEALTQTTEGKAVAAILADKEFVSEILESLKKLDNLKNVTDENLVALLQKYISEIQTILKSQLFGDIINPEMIQYIKTTLELAKEIERPSHYQSMENLTKVNELTNQLEYRVGQIKSAVESFGSFNPFSDDTLFFRPGLINFSHVAKVFGQMADFYAGVKLRNSKIQNQVDSDMQDFLETCGIVSKGLSWVELNKKEPTCRNKLIKTILTYRHGQILEGDTSIRIEQPVGKYLRSFPTTSILIGQSANLYKTLKKEYQTATSPDFGSRFKADYSDLHFGYWGQEKDLNTIERNLRYNQNTSDDEKSSKFYSLGESTWFDVLRTSPAEPGLSNLVELNSEYVSAGGWSDLHPTLVLKAQGCSKVIYVTRVGGESVFGQGVAKRLVDMDGFEPSEWKDLTTSEKFEKNIKGNPRDYGRSASTWSKLYNMGNSYSSIRRSLRHADELVCTNWDNFDVKKEFNELVQDSYNSYPDSGKSVCKID